MDSLSSELEAKCAEIQSIKDKEDLVNQEKPGGSITTDTELNARVQELEQQITDLKTELQQKEVESKGYEDADSVMASRDLLSMVELSPMMISGKAQSMTI
jgi:hypothetical protein